MSLDSFKLPKQKNEDFIIHDSQYSPEQLKQIIRSLNLKVTQQRLVILQTLSEGRRHLTAQELYEKVLPQFPEIGFATVYRFLRDLSEKQFVTEVRMGGMPARYELAPREHHDHLTCTRCGKICEFENKAIERLQEQVAQEFGFRLTHHVLELYGICPTCQEQSESL